MQIRKRTSQKAFTLVEVLIYTAVLGVIATLISGIIMLVYQNKIAVEDRIEITQALRNVVKSIRDDMYLADGFTVADGSTLTITSSVNNQPDVTYEIQARQLLRIQESDTAALTSQLMEVSQFELEDISTPSSGGTLRLTLQVRNFPRLSLKPPVEETVTTVISLKYL